MHSHEMDARPRHIRDKQAHWRRHWRIDYGFTAELCETEAQTTLDDAVVKARRGHDHAAPDVEFYFSRHICVARIVAKSAIPRRQFFPGERRLDQLVHVAHKNDSTPRFLRATYVYRRG